MIAIESSNVVATSGAAEHPIARFTARGSDVVRGSVFELSTEELMHADRYEVAAYTRVAVELSSGRMAWAYVDADHAATPRPR